MKKVLIVIAISFCFLATKAQDRLQDVRYNLKAMAVDYPGLESPVNFSVNGTSIPSFITAIANTHNLNVSVANNVEGSVVNNFTNATVIDVFLFLCQKYDLDIEFAGRSIISFVNYDEEIIPQKYISKIPIIEYNDSSRLVSMDLQKDSLKNVVRYFSEKTGVNIVLDPLVKDDIVTTFIKNRPIESSMAMMALSNGLQVKKEEDYYWFEKVEAIPVNTGNNKNKNKGRNNYNYSNSSNSNIYQKFISVENGVVNVTATDVPIIELISEVSKGMYKNFFVNEDITGNVSINVQGATYEDFLKYVFTGTKFGYKTFEGVYLIGTNASDGMRDNKVIEIKNRVVEGISALLPAYMKTGVDIMEYLGTNSLILSGPANKIQDITKMVEQLDQIVPNIQINLMIMDVQKSNLFVAGVQAGIGSQPTGQTQGTLIDANGGMNLNLSTESINNLVSGLNGTGLVNIGQISPNVYMTISAMEQNGILKVHSKPSLSAQNGENAKLSIGETNYYFESSNQIVPVNNGGNGQTVFTNTGTYKPLNANLSILIRPIASSDGHVTLKITVDQKDFTDRIGADGPIGTVNRSFESTIRIKNGETLLLGGLEQKKRENSGGGIPGLTKIPILKWFFGKRTKTKSDARLTILISPKVTY